MTSPSNLSHAEKVLYMHRWCAKNGASLKLEGECGFGRECVGIVAQGHEVYPDYTWDNEKTYERLDNNGEVWTPENAYHKHPCVAVLGRGEAAEAQLYEWLRWFDDQGFVLEVGDIPGVTDPLRRIMMQHKYARMVRRTHAEKVSP